ncbi:MAG: cobalamin-dependent protein [Candidatus Woesearchaeota archaeon]
MRRKRVLFGAAYSVIEPLGLLHLAGLARDLGWERKIVLVKDHDFIPFFEKVRDFRPDIIGLNVYTGNHMQMLEACRRIRAEFPETRLALGGPHATYFPAETAHYADYVVIGEGFGALKEILTNSPKQGVIPITMTERFPMPDRKTFYEDYPEHARSRIKSAITTTGRPYQCSYCYNSSSPDDIKEGLDVDIFSKISGSSRLFPQNTRSVDDLIAECREIREGWPETEVIYFQDDVHALDTRHNGWMEQFAKRMQKEVGLPYHAQLCWEMINPQSVGIRRLDLLQEAGCFGLTLSIEAADPVIRREVLNRNNKEDLMFSAMKELIKRGMRVRTEQITGLPYGATTIPTRINLDADLQLVELNVRLFQLTGGPTMAWASTLAPYKKTKIGSYCEQYGHYEGHNNDVPDTFFDRSVLRFPKQWVGPELAARKSDPGVWLQGSELERYRDQNAELRNIFNLAARLPGGHKFAEAYLKSKEQFSFERLGQEIREHLLFSYDPEAAGLLESIKAFSAKIPGITQIPEEQKCLSSLAGYFGCLPKSEFAAQKFLEYSRRKGITPKSLSTATRHHLYDNVLYATK